MKEKLEVALVGHSEGEKAEGRYLERRIGLGNVRTLYFSGCFCVSRCEVGNVDGRRAF